MTMVIGIGHRARQGKDMLADVLREHHGFKVLRFADELKSECERYFGWSMTDKNVMARDAITASRWDAVDGTDGWELLPGIGVTRDGEIVRFETMSLLQWFGTDFRRRDDDDYWVRRVMGRVDGDTVISDMRFLNEASAIKSVGGVTVRVRRMIDDKTQYISPDRDSNHPSEVTLIDYAFDINVDVRQDDLESVRSELMTVAATIVGKHIGHEGRQDGLG